MKIDLCLMCPTPMASDGTPMHAHHCAQYTGLVTRGRSWWGGVAGSRCRVLCADGRIRVALVTAEAETFWTVPARVKVKGRIVTGFIYVETLTDVGSWRFSPSAGLRNADALPEWAA